jgi:type I restriction enzyme S subunit
VSGLNGEIARDSWRTYSLGELATFINGRAFKPAEWGTTGLPIVRIQNLTSADAEANYFDGDLAAKHRIDDGDLLVSWSASLDTFLWERGPAALNQHIFKVEENRDLVDRRFLYYALRAVMGTIRSQIHGSTMQHITKPKFESTVVRVPACLAEQRSVADRLAQKMDEARAVADAVARQQQALEDASAAVLRAALEGAHGGAVEEVEVGSVLAKTQYGLSIAGDRSGIGTPMLRMGNIQDARLDLSDLVYVRLSERDLSKYRLERGDVLIVRTSGSAQHVGKAAVFGRDEDYVFASYLIRLRTNRERCLPEYLHGVLTSAIGRAYVERVRHQVGQNNINASEIKAMPIPLPTIAEQRDAVGELQRCEPLIDRMVAASDTAKEAVRALPDALLQDLFEADTDLEESA